jgi:hypothetical protein
VFVVLFVHSKYKYSLAFPFPISDLRINEFICTWRFSTKYLKMHLEILINNKKEILAPPEYIFKNYLWINSIPNYWWEEEGQIISILILPAVACYFVEIILWTKRGPKHIPNIVVEQQK